MSRTAELGRSGSGTGKLTGDEIIGDGGSVGRTVGAWLKSARAWILIGVLLIITVILGVLAAGSGLQPPLSPTSAAPEGARAAAQVLERSGVRVVVAGSIDEAVNSLQGGDDTLLLHDPNGWLDSEQLATLGNGASDRLVLIEPGVRILTEIGEGIRSAGIVPTELSEPLPAECTNPAARAAAAISAGGYTYRGAAVCFPVPAENGNDAGGVLATTQDADVVVLGNGAAVSNELIDEHGNAALVLRTLGSTSTLVWYQPTADDLAVTPGAQDPLALLPEFVDPLMVWLLVIAMLAILWRARRLGPLVTEPLPVVVRSAETAAGRARLYQDAGAVGHAAETLRAASLARIAAVLRVPDASSRAAVVAAAARRTNREYADLDRLLNTYKPHSDAQLVGWSQDLEDLEQEIRRA